MWVEEQKNGKAKFIERYEDYLTGTVKRVSVVLDKNTAQTRKLAQSVLDEKIGKALDKRVAKKTTLKNLVDSYRNEQLLTVKKSTYTRNYHACKTLMLILGENTLVDRLTANYIRERLLLTGKEPGTLNEHLVRLKALIRWGYQNDYIADISFLDKIDSFKDKPHREKIEDKFLESKEVRKLLNGMQNEVWKLLTRFLVLSGLRFGEAVALTKKDVDMKSSLIHITKTFDSINVEITTPKTSCSIRDVYIQAELAEVCKQIKSYMLRQRLMFGYESDLFFSNVKGGYIRYYAYKIGRAHV